MNAKSEESVRLRSFQGKQLLSYLRKGDYAHPGETEAIVNVMEKFDPHSSINILDVGCGLGGTAHFIKELGYDHVTGIDIELESITHAKENYPSINFYASDVVNLPLAFPEHHFDLFLLFNSFYAFEDQDQSLRALNKIAKQGASIAIFDYSDKKPEGFNPFLKEAKKSGATFNPVDINNIESSLMSAGWELLEAIDISEDYARWYFNLLQTLRTNKNFIIDTFGHTLFSKAEKTYTDIYDALLNNSLGGIIVYAKK